MLNSGCHMTELHEGGMDVEEGMKDQKNIRLGLIGVGNWALFAHVRVLRLLPEYEIVAIYSQRKKAAKAAATEYGIPHVAESLDALVRDPLVDQVLVLTTSQQHEEGIRAAGGIVNTCGCDAMSRM